MPQAIKPRQRWRHYKGGLYKIVTLARLEATQEDMVVYQHLGSGLIWVRPLSEFLSLAPATDANLRSQPRFSLVEGRTSARS